MMANIIKEGLANFGLELLDSIRNNANEHISDERFEEKIFGIEKATAAMFDAGVDSNTIIQLLQKHWDLRLSEAASFVAECQRKENG